MSIAALRDAATRAGWPEDKLCTEWALDRIPALEAALESLIVNTDLHGHLGLHPNHPSVQRARALLPQSETFAEPVTELGHSGWYCGCGHLNEIKWDSCFDCGRDRAVTPSANRGTVKP